MTEHEASRTLVKSAPELWAECSDAASLARHLGQFGEIRITRLEPETAVAWEGERISGTVRLEPSGWGTRVTLTASADERPLAEEPARPDAPRESDAPPQADAPPPAEVAEAPPELVLTPAGTQVEPVRGGLFSRLRSLMGGRALDEVRTAKSATPAITATTAAEAPPPEPTPAAPTDAPPPPPAATAEDPEPAATAEAPEATPTADPPDADATDLDAVAALSAALESLGQAHHRPYSRA